MRNYLTFDNKDLRDFGVYITGQGAFRAPARVYDPITIPNRNGDLLGIEDRLENLEIVYPAFIFTNFKTQVAALRAFLLSHKGYFTLRDSYHPNEYRKAYYKGPFDPDVTANNGAGSFNLVFICKPQRFLDSGDIVTSIIGGAGTSASYSGNPATFSGAQGDLITSLSVPFSPIQSLNGYSKPWPAGGGKNLLNVDTNTTGYSIGATGNIVQRASGNYTDLIPVTVGQQYTFSAKSGVYSNEIRRMHGYDSNGTWVQQINYKSGAIAVGTAYSFSGTIPSGVSFVRVSYEKVDTEAQLELGSASTYAPYSNICPISGRTGLTVCVSPSQDVADATAYASDWTSTAGMVYGGTLDVVSGVLTVDKVCVNLGDYDWTYDSTYTRFQHTFANIKNLSARTLPMQCSALESIYDGRAIGSVPDNAVYSGNLVVNIKYSAAGGDTTAFKTAMNGVQLCYPLGSPYVQTYQLTPQQVTALVGQNYVWSNLGGVDLVVFTPIPAIIDNPTLFDAKPLLRVYGTGTLGIASSTITISSADVYTDIDCELMDCYKGSANKNQYVQFSSNDFPVLKPGTTGFTFSGVTQVDIIPRWFSV